MNYKTLAPILNLHLFDGEGAGEGSAAAAPAAEMGGSENNTMPKQASEGKKGDLKSVKYGKQAEMSAEQLQAASATALTGETQPGTVEDRRAKFEEMINGEYKDMFTEKTQSIIDRRFAKSKQTESENAELHEITDMLKARYGVDQAADLKALKTAIENDDATWADAAEAEGMTIDQYKRYDSMRRENAAMKAAKENDIQQQQARAKAQSWFNESQSLMQKYPDFNLKQALQNEAFRAGINAGVPMETMWLGMNFGNYANGVAEVQKSKTEKAVTENIRARGNRPAENGTSQSAGFITKSDPSKLTLEDFAEIERRVRHGDTISF